MWKWLREALVAQALIMLAAFFYLGWKSNGPFWTLLFFGGGYAVIAFLMWFIDPIERWRGSRNAS